MADLKLEEIAERVVDAILEEGMFNKDNLMSIVHPVLKIWIKQTDKPKKQIKKKEVYIHTIARKEVELMYWKTKFRNLIGEDQIQSFYDELGMILEDKNLKEFKQS